MKEFIKKYWWLLFLAVFICWLGYWLVLRYHVATPTDRGQFGDAFGALNALFAGLAFAGLIIAIFLQREDIKLQSKALEKQTEEIKLQNDVLDLQRQELSDTRKVLEDQKGQFEEQSKIMRKQSFEDTFFKLISLHHEIVNAMKVPGGQSGTRCLEFLYTADFLQDYNRVEKLDNSKDKSEVIKIVYGHFYARQQIILGHYFRNLYQVIKFIKKSDIEDKHFYSDLIRAQLSSAELKLLFYNCLSEYGTNFKPYIEEFALLKHLDRDDLFNRNDEEGLYDVSAYEDQETS